MAKVHQLAPPVASVLAPLPMAVVMAVINAEPQSAITTLVMLSFPMTLIIGLQFFLARGVGFIGWASAIVGGLIAGSLMMNVLGMVPPPESLDAMGEDGGLQPVGAAGAVLYFLLPGIVTALSFWSVIRIQCWRAFVPGGVEENSSSANE